MRDELAPAIGTKASSDFEECRDPTLVDPRRDDADRIGTKAGDPREWHSSDHKATLRQAKRLLDEALASLIRTTSRARDELETSSRNA